MDLLRTDSQSERGVSLIETLVALLILSFVAVSTLAMFQQGLRLNAAGVDYSSITNVAKDKSEELLVMNYDDPSLAPDVVFTEDRNDPDVSISWRVAEHYIAQGSSDPATVFSGGHMISTSAGSGNLKIIAITVNSDNTFAVGRRTVTVQAIKAAD